MGEGDESKLKRLGKQIGSLCSCFYPDQDILTPTTISSSGAENGPSLQEDAEQGGLRAKSLCAICLDPLLTGTTPTSMDAPSLFTAECTHIFHFSCIASNVRHGSITCPICRAHWSHLPRHPLTTTSTSDPILQILDASITTSRVNRRSSARMYNDDDPLDPILPVASAPRLRLALVGDLYLSVKLTHQTPRDLVLVISPNGPHLHLLKQAVSLVVFALCSSDRLAIVTYSASGATRAFPLRRMSPHGKQSALRLINRILYLGPTADSAHGIQKGVKILEDRSHSNSNCCILHLSDSPACRSLQASVSVSIPVHWFHVGFGFGASNGFVMHEFEEFLGRLMGGVVREAKVRIGCEGEWVRLGFLRGGEERRIPIGSKEGHDYVCVGFSYIEGGSDEAAAAVTGEMVVGYEEKGENRRNEEMESCVERRDFLDPFMARRWAKHLHRA